MLRKKSILLVVMVALLAIVNANAESTMTFVAGGDVCTPMTVTVGGNSYTVYSSLTIGSVSGTVRAVDCRGHKLTYSYLHRGNSYDFADTYTFQMAYDPDYDSSSSSDSYGSSSNYGSSDNMDNLGRSVGNGVGNLLFGLGGGAEGEAYPSLQALIGFSRCYGQNLRLRYTGSGCNVYGSIGKDWVCDSEFGDRILWNAGIGSYFAFGPGSDPSMDIAAGLSCGQLAQYEKISLMIDVDYTFWIGRWRRVGLFAGGSFGWGDFGQVFNSDETGNMGKFAWSLEAGFVLRLANF